MHNYIEQYQIAHQHNLDQSLILIEVLALLLGLHKKINNINDIYEKVKRLLYILRFYFCVNIGKI